MGSEFKKEQKVKCIRSHISKSVQEGKIYIVDQDSDGIYVAVINDYGESLEYFQNRFIPAWNIDTKLGQLL